MTAAKIDDLIARLRGRQVRKVYHFGAEGSTAEWKADVSDEDCQEAADLLSDLKAENERLRAALRPFADRAAHLDPSDPDELWWWHPGVGSPVTAGHLRAARSALTAEEG